MRAVLISPANCLKAMSSSSAHSLFRFRMDFRSGPPERFAVQLRGHSLDVVVGRRDCDDPIGAVTAGRAFKRPVLPAVFTRLALNHMSAVAAFGTDDRCDRPKFAGIERIA
jgi:hypothetical protein